MARGISRRDFLQTTVGVAAAMPITGLAQDVPNWSGSVLDVHLHPRATAEGCFNHIQGCGVSKAVLLTNINAEDRARAAITAYPGRFVRFASIDVRQPDALAQLRTAIQGGALGFGEIKSQVAAAGPEMRGVYALAAELGVPVTIHFQEISQPGSQGTFNTGIKTFDAMLKAFPKTTFFGHADAFWANVSADYAEDVAYPTGKVKPGGPTDRFLSDYPNLYADMSANSCNNFLNRDPEFAAGFIARHQNKLMFGSDCPCQDGRGTGTPANRCVARATLTALQKLASPAVFRKIVWENGTRLLKL